MWILIIFIWGFSSPLGGFGRLPKEKNGAPADSSERPFFRCVATPDVLANQQVTPVWQTSFSASVHTLAVLALLSNLTPQPLCSAIFTRTRTLFSS